MKEYYRVCANIDLDAIEHNIRMTKKQVGKTKVMAIIKTDGYGHGAIPIAKVIDHLVDEYGVAIVEEGIELRKAGIVKPILVLGPSPKELFEELIDYDLTQTVFQLDKALILNGIAQKKNKKAKIHIKVDTGMSRIGLQPNEDGFQIIKDINKLACIDLDGIYTHFACADTADKESVHHQFNVYRSFIQRLEAEGITFRVKHAANSASIIELPEAYLDMVRSGISTYGLYPSLEVSKESMKLTPAMEIKSNIAYLKEIMPGVGIGYGCTFVAKNKMTIATIPVGYGDGYPRNLSNKGRVLINGKSAPIVGRICMDQFMVDVTQIPDAKEGDEVTLIGRDDKEFISVEEAADLVGSFNYEFVCDVGKRIPRVFYYKGNKVGTLDYYDTASIAYDLNEDMLK